MVTTADLNDGYQSRGGSRLNLTVRCESVGLTSSTVQRAGNNVFGNCHFHEDPSYVLDWRV